jgi:hypothetical protein
MLRDKLPESADAMATALARDARTGSYSAVAEVYEHLTSIDFSRAVVQGAETRLRVVTASACGWSDLGTPQRVAQTLKRIEAERLERAVSFDRPSALLHTPAFINLAAEHARLGVAG